jgi:hypothetical protein
VARVETTTLAAPARCAGTTCVIKVALVSEASIGVNNLRCSKVYRELTILRTSCA